MSADTNNHLPPDGDSPDDLQTLAGQYVLGTQDAAQRRAIEDRLPHDSALRAAVSGRLTVPGRPRSLCIRSTRADTRELPYFLR